MPFFPQRRQKNFIWYFFLSSRLNAAMVRPVRLDGIYMKQQGQSHSMQEEVERSFLFDLSRVVVGSVFKRRQSTCDTHTPVLLDSFFRAPTKKRLVRVLRPLFLNLMEWFIFNVVEHSWLCGQSLQRECHVREWKKKKPRNWIRFPP